MRIRKWADSDDTRFDLDVRNLAPLFFWQALEDFGGLLRQLLNCFNRLLLGRHGFTLNVEAHSSKQGMRPTICVLTPHSATGPTPYPAKVEQSGPSGVGWSVRALFANSEQGISM